MKIGIKVLIVLAYIIVCPIVFILSFIGTLLKNV